MVVVGGGAAGLAADPAAAAPLLPGLPVPEQRILVTT
jgi:hypothetical protein